MSIDGVIRKTLTCRPDAPAYVAAQIAAELTAEQMQAYFVELLTARIDDILRLHAAAARNAALNNGRRSWKHSQGRSPWQRMCDSTVWVDGEPKRTGACSREDLMSLIGLRRTQIEHLNNQITNFERLIHLLDQHDVKFVDEIPEEMILV